MSHNAIKGLSGQRHCVEVIRDEDRLRLNVEALGFRFGTFNALCTQVDARYVHASSGELDAEVSLTAPELENVRASCDSAFDQMSVFLAEEDLKQLCVVPNLWVVGILLNFAPMPGLLGYQFVVLVGLDHAVCQWHSKGGEQLLISVLQARNEEVPKESREGLLLVRRRTVLVRFISRAKENRKSWVSWKARVGLGSFAESEVAVARARDL